jgi:hypothetical protein
MSVSFPIEENQGQSRRRSIALSLWYTPMNGEMTAKMNATEKASNEILRHLAAAKDFVRQCRHANGYGILIDPRGTSSSINDARFELEKAAALWNNTSWPTDADYLEYEHELGQRREEEEAYREEWREDLRDLGIS